MSAIDKGVSFDYLASAHCNSSMAGYCELPLVLWL